MVAVNLSKIFGASRMMESNRLHNVGNVCWHGKFHQQVVKASDGIQLISGRASFDLDAWPANSTKGVEIDCQTLVVFNRVFTNTPGIAVSMTLGRKLITDGVALRAETSQLDPHGFMLRILIGEDVPRMPIRISWLAVGHNVDAQRGVAPKPVLQNAFAND